jgi:hypothetical protein
MGWPKFGDDGGSNPATDHGSWDNPFGDFPKFEDLEKEFDDEKDD